MLQINDQSEYTNTLLFTDVQLVGMVVDIDRYAHHNEPTSLSISFLDCEVCLRGYWLSDKGW